MSDLSKLYDTYAETQGPRDEGVVVHPSHWNGYGGDGRLTWADRDARYGTDGSDLYIASPGDRLERLVGDIQFLDKLLSDPNSRNSPVDWQSLEDAAQEIKMFYQTECQEMDDNMIAEHGSGYARAIQDWVMQELAARYPNHQSSHHEEKPDELPVDLLATIDILDSLMVELTADDEDSRLLELASTWRMELLAELCQAKVQLLYRLAA